MFLMVLMTFKEELLGGFWCAFIATRAEGCVGLFDVVEVSIEAYVASSKLEEERSLGL